MWFWKSKKTEVYDGRMEESSNRLKEAVGLLNDEAEEVKRNISTSDDFERRLRGISDLFSDSVIVINSQSIILAFNKAAEDVFEWSKEEIIGMPLTTLMVGDTRHHAQHTSAVSAFASRHHKDCDCDRCVYASNRVVGHVREISGKRKSGEVFPIEISVTEIERGDNGILYMGVIRDISARKEAERQLQNQKAFFEDVLNVLPIRVFIKDAHGEYKFVNKAYLDDFNLDSESIIGHRDDDLWSPDVIDIIKEEDTNIFQSGEPLYIERPIDGIHCYIGKVKLHHNEEDLIAGFTLNVHERKIYQEKLEEQKRHLRALFNNSPFGMAMVDLDGKIVDSNRKFGALLHKNRSETLGKSVLEFLDAKDHSAMKTFLQDGNVRGTLKGEFHFVNRHTDKILDCRVTISHMDSESDKLHFAMIVEDFTNLTEKDRQVKALVRAINHATDSIVITNVEGKIVFVNDSFLHRYGYTREETVGNNPGMFKSGMTSPELYQELWSTIMSGKVWSGILINKTKEGHVVEEETTITPIRNGGHKIAYFMAIKKGGRFV